MTKRTTAYQRINLRMHSLFTEAKIFHHTGQELLRRRAEMQKSIDWTKRITGYERAYFAGMFHASYECLLQDLRFAYALNGVIVYDASTGFRSVHDATIMLDENVLGGMFYIDKGRYYPFSLQHVNRKAPDCAAQFPEGFDLAKTCVATG